jgi:hypothetical protein
VPVPFGAASVQGVRQVSPPLPKLASAPGGIDDTCTGMPGWLKPGMLKLGMLNLGTLKLGMLGIPVQPDKTAPLNIDITAIARRIILIPGPRGPHCAR